MSIQIPNIFKQRTGAIQLSDLDDNFDLIKVTVNTQETQIAALQAGQASLTQQIANFSAIPIGCIVMWSGSIATIPDKWRLCDGTNNTPDLRDKFVIGARADSSGSATTFVTGADTKSGGTKDAAVVSHSHTATSSANSSSSVSNDTDSWSGTLYASDSGLTGSGVFSNGGTNNNTFSDNSFSSTNNENSTVNASHTHTHNHTVTVTTNVSTTVDSTGSTGTNANLPPYYSLAYIMKIV